MLDVNEALFDAVAADDLETVVDLLHNVVFDGGVIGKAVGVAARKGHLRALDVLLPRSLNIENADSGRALCLAARHGHSLMVSHLLQCDGDAGYLNNEALCLAACNGHVKIVNLLLQYGANINARGGLALRNAVLNNHFHVVSLLLKKGAHIPDDLRFSAPSASSASSATIDRHCIAELLEKTKAKRADKAGKNLPSAADMRARARKVAPNMNADVGDDKDYSLNARTVTLERHLRTLLAAKIEEIAEDCGPTFFTASTESDVEFGLEAGLTDVLFPAAAAAAGGARPESRDDLAVDLRAVVKSVRASLAKAGWAAEHIMVESEWMMNPNGLGYDRKVTLWIEGFGYTAE